MELWSMPLTRIVFQNLLIATIVLFTSNTVLATPDHPPGNIVFLGITSDGQRSVWLSQTSEGMFEVQARNQIVDDWTQPQPGLHTTFSPFVSQGSGDPHSLYQIIDGELVFLDKDNQQGGITFPPLPGGLPPGEVTPPIELPPSGGGGSSASTASALAKGGGDGFTNTVSVTPGREFAKQPFFNFWVDNRYFDIRDFRFLLDRKGSATNITMGGDRLINNKAVIGAMLAHNTGKSSSFNDTWKTSARGFTFGPYFGYKFLPNWAMDGTLCYSQFENHNDIAILKSRYKTQVYSVSFVARGVYNVGSILLQPKPALFYSYFYIPGYNMYATNNGILFSIPRASVNCAYGLSQLSLEASKHIRFAHGTMTAVPYVDIGVNYAFVQPNGGKILGGDLRAHQTSPWSGLARLGVRTLITQSFFIEATASYMSFGQPHLRIWQSRLFLSWAIN